MFGRILRQYRRWLFAAAMLGVFVLLDVFVYHRFSDGPFGLNGDFGDPVFLASLLLALLIFAGVPTLVLAILFPTMLGLVEIVAVSLVLTSSIVVALPVSWQIGWVDCFVLFAVNHLLITAMAGNFRWLNLQRLAAPQVMRFQTRATPQQVWSKLVPAPGQLADYFVPGATILAAPEGTGASFLLVTPQRKDLGEKSELWFVDANVPFSRLSARIKSLAEMDPDIPFDIFDVTIAPTATGGSDVTITKLHANTTLGTRIYWAMMDANRDARACYRQRIEGKRDWSIWGTQLPKPAR